MRQRVPRNQNYSAENIEEMFYQNDQQSVKTRREERKKNSIKRESHHQNVLEKIVSDPALIGINQPIEEYSIELNIKNQFEEGRVDLVLLSKNTSYYIEYKGNDTPYNRKTAKKQLKKAKRCLENEHKKRGNRMLYVHGEFKTDKLTHKGFVPFNYND